MSSIKFILLLIFIIYNAVVKSSKESDVYDKPFSNTIQTSSNAPVESFQASTDSNQLTDAKFDQTSEEAFVTEESQQETLNTEVESSNDGNESTDFLSDSFTDPSETNTIPFESQFAPNDSFSSMFSKENDTQGLSLANEYTWQWNNISCDNGNKQVKIFCSTYSNTTLVFPDSYCSKDTRPNVTEASCSDITNNENTESSSTEELTSATYNTTEADDSTVEPDLDYETQTSAEYQNNSTEESSDVSNDTSEPLTPSELTPTALDELLVTSEVIADDQQDKSTESAYSTDSVEVTQEDTTNPTIQEEDTVTATSDLEFSVYNESVTEDSSTTESISTVVQEVSTVDETSEEETTSSPMAITTGAEEEESESTVIEGESTEITSTESTRELDDFTTSADNTGDETSSIIEKNVSDITTKKDFTEYLTTAPSPPSRVTSYYHVIINEGEDVLIQWFCPPRTVSYLPTSGNAAYSWYKLNSFTDDASSIKVSVSSKKSGTKSGFLFILRKPSMEHAGLYVCEERNFTVNYYYYRLDVFRPDSLNKSTTASQSCSHSLYGCCPDGVNRRLSLSMHSCPRPTDCKFSVYGCCSDGISSAWGPAQRGCPDKRYQPQLCPTSASSVMSQLISSGNVSVDYLSASIWFMYLSEENYCRPFLANTSRSHEGAFALLEDCEISCVHPVNTGRCHTEPDFYKCNRSDSAWYFDNLDMECKRTRCIKGGNYFPTKRVCSSTCLPVTGLSRCREPGKIRGFQCRSMIRSVFYNIAQGSCDWFEYDGCGGNWNRYPDIQQCRDECASKAQLLFEDSDWMCRQPVNLGICQPQIHPTSINRDRKSSSRRWYYDPVSKYCREMNFSDCSGGNANNFLSLKDCQGFCSAKKLSPEMACSLAPAPGSCHRKSARWFFNATSNGCEKFLFTGCDGNENNFLNKSQCQGQCGAKFFTTSEMSSTEARMSTFRPDNVTVTALPQLVEKFVPALLRKDPCMVDYSPGECLSSIANRSVTVTRFYYDRQNGGRCRRFQFSGCGGGANMFDTKADCISNCRYRLMKKKNRGCNPNRYDIQYCKSALPQPGQDSLYVYNAISNECQPLHQEANSHASCSKIKDHFFKTERFCKFKCLSPRPTVQNLQNRCLAPHDSINCHQRQIRYGFQSELKQCIEYKACHSAHSASFDEKLDCQKVCETKSLKDVCSLPNDRGPCNGISIRFYYNVAAGKCLMFIYGGCLGNLNRFTSEIDCQRVCQDEMTHHLSLDVTTQPPYPTTLPTKPSLDNQNEMIIQNYQDTMTYDICYPPPHYGTTGCQPDSSEAELTRYFYDRNMGKCIEFIFSGCQAMPNNFESLEDCQRVCTYRIKRVKADNEGCYSNFMKCRDHNIIRWKSNPIEGKCVRFPSCDEEAGFSSEVSCMHKCLPLYPKVLDLQDICHIPPRTSQCDTMPKPGWIFDLKTRRCRIVKNLCPGYGNNFPSEQTCRNTCQPKKLREVCRLPLDHGPCRTFSLRWYYDWDDHVCKQFYYGGCFGNRNRFISYKECQKACHDSDFCRQPLSDGQSQCDSKQVSENRFFYNITSKQCESFVYAGCLSNGNNFKTFANCQKSCLSPDANREDPCEENLFSLPSNCSDPSSQTIMLLFFFNKSSKQCGSYLAKVCMDVDIKTKIKGKNLFESMKECELTCVSTTPDNDQKKIRKDFSTSELMRCFDPLEHHSKVDICSSFSMVRYFYNSSSKRCDPYDYNGCDGKEDRKNRFESVKLCQEMCEDAIRSKNITRPVNCPKCKNHCEYGRLRLDNGCRSCNCRNPCLGIRCPVGSKCQLDCQRFGNYKWGCEATCHLNHIKHPERCLRSPHLAGEIDVKCSRVPYNRYFYDWRTGRCHSEEYTGCNEGRATDDSTQNWFTNEEECYRQCSGIVRTEFDQCLGQDCPYNTKCVAQCWADQGASKCSTKCVPFDKPGQCPRVKSLSPTCSWQLCSLDAHCPGQQKCCPCLGKKTSFCEELPKCTTAQYGCCWNNKTISRDVAHRDCSPKSPQIAEFNEANIWVSENSFLILECKVIAAPKPSIFWRRPKQNENERGSYVEAIDIFFDRESSSWIGRFNISSVDSRHGGEWFCEAINNRGVATKSIRVMVMLARYRRSIRDPLPQIGHGTPIRIMKGTLSIVQAVEGTIVSLYCDSYGDPKANIIWLYRKSHGDKLISMNSSASANQILQISNWSNHNAGLYTCIAQHSADRPTVAHTIQAKFISQSEVSSTGFIVSNRAGFLSPGTALQLRCVPGSGMGRIYQIKWYKSDQVLLPNTKSRGIRFGQLNSCLIIGNLSVPDSGRYSCLILGSGGVRRIDTVVTVLPSL